MMKLLLYCTKAKPYLLCEPYIDKNKPCRLLRTNIDKTIYNCAKENAINGKIVAECDFEVEEIKNKLTNNNSHLELFTNQLSEEELFDKSCLSRYEMFKYLKNDFSKKGEPNGYAIYIKNLHIFDEPRELKYYFTENPYKDINKIFTDEIMVDGKWYRPVNKAPQNMMKVWEDLENPRVLISIRPEWICKILNGEKTIEVRKKVLKEMTK